MIESEFNKLRDEGRIYFGKSGNSQPNVIRYLDEVEGFVPWTWWPHEEVGHTDEARKEIQALFRTQTAFDTPKPTRLIERVLQIATDPGDIILDSFAGSGTTGHAVLNLNVGQVEITQDATIVENEPTRDLFKSLASVSVTSSPRRFILVELEPKIAREVTAERVRRVAQGYTNAKGACIESIGGGFRYCTLGNTLFHESGKIRESVRFSDLARHVYFTETGEPLPRERVPNSPLLGVCRGVAVYLLYNGILGDKSTNGGNVLTRATLAQLPTFEGAKVVYCAGCLLGDERLAQQRITVRQTPYEIRIS